MIYLCKIQFLYNIDVKMYLVLNIKGYIHYVSKLVFLLTKVTDPSILQN